LLVGFQLLPFVPLAKTRLQLLGAAIKTGGRLKE
jgi:hypothetical protein